MGGGLLSNDSANAWAELKVFSLLPCATFKNAIADNYYQTYFEAQTESIIYAIQCVLSGIHAATPSPSLNENLTQIITIVSSIVAICTTYLHNPPLPSRATS